MNGDSSGFVTVRRLVSTGLIYPTEKALAVLSAGPSRRVGECQRQHDRHARRRRDCRRRDVPCAGALERHGVESDRLTEGTMIELVIGLVVLGAVLYLIEALIPMPPPVKVVVRVVIVLLMVPDPPALRASSSDADAHRLLIPTARHDAPGAANEVRVESDIDPRAGGHLRCRMGTRGQIGPECVTIVRDQIAKSCERTRCST